MTSGVENELTKFTSQNSFRNPTFYALPLLVKLLNLNWYDFSVQDVSIPNPTLVGRKAYCFLVLARVDVIEGCLLACVIVSTSPQGLIFL